MILVFSGLLMVVSHMGVHLPKPLHERLLVRCVLTSGHLGVELVHNLETISQIVLHGGGARLVVKHVEHLPKVHRRPIGSPVPNQPEHHAVRVVPQFYVLVHPHLT
ncbi:C5 [Galium leaf distortion virus]|nr:C5 [Galium leaf distortion virus]